jgi:hypothetical protein
MFARAIALARVFVVTAIGLWGGASISLAVAQSAESEQAARWQTCFDAMRYVGMPPLSTREGRAEALGFFEDFNKQYRCPIALPYLVIGYRQGWADQGAQPDRAVQTARHLVIELFGRLDRASFVVQERRESVLADSLSFLDGQYVSDIKMAIGEQIEWFNTVAQSVSARYYDAVTAYHGLQTPRNARFARALAAMPTPESATAQDSRKIGVLIAKFHDGEEFSDVGRGLIRANASEDTIAARLTAENEYAAGAYRQALIWYLVAMLRGELVTDLVLDDLRARFSDQE